MVKNIIAWDLGSTKCTAGLVEYQENNGSFICKKVCTYKLTSATSLENLISEIESALDFAMPHADAICIGAAGQFDGETLYHDNPYPYPMTFAKIAKQQHWPRFDVIHDYSPLVCATFTANFSEEKSVKRLNNAVINPHGRRVALGIGTGLGLKDGTLLPDGDFWLGKNEVGHIGITVPPMANEFHQQRHEELMHFLKNGSPITFEKILSGQGTVRLYHFFYPSKEEITPEQVGDKMRAGEVPELIDAFAWYIGLFIGTVQLIFMPEGGIWITGGVSLHHLAVFDHPALIAGIHTSPAYLPQREKYPLGIMCDPNHALIGSGYYAIKKIM